MQYNKRSEVQQIEVLPRYPFVQVLENIIVEATDDDGATQEIGRTGHRRVLNSSDVDALSEVLGGFFNVQLAAALAQAHARVAELEAQIAALQPAAE